MEGDRSRHRDAGQQRMGRGFRGPPVTRTPCAPFGGMRADMLPQVDPETGRLFEQATTGDRVALDSLLERYLPQLHAFVHARLGPGLRPRESSVDVVQSV